MGYGKLDAKRKERNFFLNSTSNGASCTNDIDSHASAMCGNTAF